MAADGRTMHGGTYNSSPLVCAAVIAAAARDRRRGFYEDLTRAARDWPRAWSRRAGRGPRGLLERRRRPFQLWFAPARRPTTAGAYAIVASSPFPTLHAELRDRGVLIQPPQEGLLLLSGAHTDDDIDRTLEAAAEAMPAVAAAAERGDGRPRGRTCDEGARAGASRAPGGRPRRGLWRQRQCVRGGGSASGTPVNGGMLRAGIPDNPDHLDPALSYTNEGWEILEATNNGCSPSRRPPAARAPRWCRTSRPPCRG